MVEKENKSLSIKITDQWFESDNLILSLQNSDKKLRISQISKFEPDDPMMIADELVKSIKWYLILCRFKKLIFLLIIKDEEGFRRLLIPSNSFRQAHSAKKFLFPKVPPLVFRRLENLASR